MGLAQQINRWVCAWVWHNVIYQVCQFDGSRKIHKLPKSDRLFEPACLWTMMKHTVHSRLYPHYILYAADIHTQSRETFPGGLFLRCKPRTADIAGLRGGGCPSPKRCPPWMDLHQVEADMVWVLFSMFTLKTEGEI